MAKHQPAAIRATISAPVVSKHGEEPTVHTLRGGSIGLSPEIYEDRATVCVALRMEGYSYPEIQEKTGLSDCQVRYACRKARAAGRLRDVLDLVDNEAVPQAVENLVKYLREPDTEMGQKATMKTLSGRGVFRNFAHNKNESAPGVTLPQLNIEIVSPVGGGVPTVVVNNERGAVIGVEKDD